MLFSINLNFLFIFLLDFQLSRKNTISFCTTSSAQQEKEENNYEFIGPLHRPINERAESIPENVIYRNRLELTGILELPKFKDYKAGTPTKVLGMNVIFKIEINKSQSPFDLTAIFYYFNLHSICSRYCTSRTFPKRQPARTLCVFSLVTISTTNLKCHTNFFSTVECEDRLSLHFQVCVRFSFGFSQETMKLI